MRQPTSTPPWLAARGLLSGALCATGTTWAHTAVAGHALGRSGLLVAVASVVACLLLARRRIGLTALLGVCLVGQGAAHAAMAIGGAAMPHPHGMSGMSGHAGPLAMLTAGGLPMLCGHLAVAVVTALLARGGEQALLDLARAVRRGLVDRLLPAAPRATGPVPTTTARRVLASEPHCTGRRVATGTGSRAPPARSGVLVPG